jgi:hypothetical protein
VAELGYWFRDSQLKLYSLHSPMFPDDVWGRSGPNAVLDITEPVKSRRLQIGRRDQARDRDRRKPFRSAI